MKKDYEALADIFQNLDRTETVSLIDKIVYECKITRHTFFNWKYGVCRIPELHKDKIEEILGKRVFDKITIRLN